MAKKKIIKKNTSKKIPKNKKTKKIKSNRNRFLLFLIKFFLVGLLFFSLFFIAVYFGFTGHVPSTRQLKKIANPQASEVLFEDGSLLGRYYIENRSNVEFNEISPNVINALIATEDARFYEHRGIDEIALMRVLVKTIILRDRSAGGGSTLSQQIAKNLFPRKDLGIISLPANKLREAIIAYRLERIYSKEEILTLYLNTVPFGENIFGIGVAAERFFNKKPSTLSVDESAVLVGMLKANNRYNPRLNPEKSKTRRNVVISLMASNGYLTEKEAIFYQEKPLKLRYTRISFNEGPAPYFLELIKPELLKWCEKNKKENNESWNLYTDGLKIKTTLNSHLQLFARQAINEHMENVQDVFNNHWQGRDLWKGKNNIITRAIQRTDRYKKMKKAGASEEEINRAFRKKTEASIFTWHGLKHVKISPLDSIKHYLSFLNAGFMAIEPSTGDLKAWVGGIDFRFFKYDHILSERQVGSTFKPFVYLSALENGLSPYDYYPAAKKNYPQYDNWSPSNSNGKHDGFFSMEGALSQSVNTVAVDILMQTGIKKVISTCKQLGIDNNLPKVPSLALGVASISLKDLLYAYATIINRGIKTEPYYLCSISSPDGKTLKQFNRPTALKTHINKINCQIITHMMQTTIDKGTGKKIRSVYNIPGDFAGKTGTTQNNSDGWFIGITPKLITGCWVGAEEPGIHFRTIRYGQGAYLSLPIVGKFFHKLYRDPRYKNLKNAKFPPMDQQLLADLDIPLYKELLEIKKEKNILERLFAGKNKNEKLKEIQHPEKKKDKKGLWQSLKGIFKKKNK